MQPDPMECMFCHDGLAGQGQPENLAWLQHLDEQEGCRESFEVWKDNMQVDFKGD